MRRRYPMIWTMAMAMAGYETREITAAHRYLFARCPFRLIDLPLPVVTTDRVPPLVFFPLNVATIHTMQVLVHSLFRERLRKLLASLMNITPFLHCHPKRKPHRSSIHLQNNAKGAIQMTVKFRLTTAGFARRKKTRGGEASAVSVAKPFAKTAAGTPSSSRKTVGHETTRGRLCLETSLRVNTGRTAPGPRRKVVPTRGSRSLLLAL